jgi:hypothetical protein
MKLVWKILIVASFVLVILSSIFIRWIILLNPHRGSTRVDTIVINEDEDFNKYGFPGSGTIQDPFRIENIELGTYEYVLREKYNLIEIRSTSVHILIQNCTFIGCVSGVYIDSIKKGSINIVNNTFIGTEFRVLDMVSSGCISIRTKHISTNTSIADNIFKGKIAPAIEIYESSNIIISKNTIMLEDDTAAIGVYYSLDIVINSNIVSPTSSSPNLDFEGLYFLYSQNCSVENNIIRNTNIEVLHCDNLEFLNNTFISEIEEFTLLGFGISSNIEITQNVFLGNMHYGIGAGSGSNLIVNNNTFDVGINALGLFNFQYALISYNSFYNGSDYAINIDSDSSNAVIYHNNFFFNNLSGDSQCYDDNAGNIWYNVVLSEGNYWNNLGSNTTYAIAGSAGSVDLYPLSEPITA